VSQATFILLALKASTLSTSRSLAGWLHCAAGYTARNALRMRRRRTSHERSAGAERSRENDAIDPGETARTWDAIEPLIDRAFDRLSSSDREALVLHYLQNLTVQQTAATMGVSFEAAKKKLHRAMMKLRSLLTHDGIGLSALALAATLQDHARATTMNAINPDLTDRVVRSLTNPTGGAAAIAKGASTMMLVRKIRTAALWTTVMLVPIGGAAAAVYAHVAHRPSTKVSITASPQMTWSEVKTIFIHDDSSPTDDCIDLDTGKTTTNDQRVASREEGRAWWRESGVDAHCETNSDPAENGLYGMGVVWVLVPNEAFDEAPADGIFTQLSQEDAANTWDNLMPVEGELPVTYAFKTKDEGFGLIQFLKVNEDPQKLGLSVRLKRVETR
jgi:RNA polymerase sigma-70 factor (ECF subfamily)